MITIYFDDEDRHSPAPYFSLNEARGQAISSRDFYEEYYLVLCFLHAPTCDTCRGFLESIVSQVKDYERVGARILAIFPMSTEALNSHLNWLDQTILVLADPRNEIRNRYAKLMAPGLIPDRAVMIFILDAYLAPYACLTDFEPDVSAQAGVMNWLQYISIQCPE